MQRLGVLEKWPQALREWSTSRNRGTCFRGGSRGSEEAGDREVELSGDWHPGSCRGSGHPLVRLLEPQKAQKNYSIGEGPPELLRGYRW